MKHEEKNLLEEADSCIRCLLCFNVCPVIQNTEGKAFYPTSFFVADALRRSESILDLEDVAHKCLICGLCSLVCPRNLDTPRAMILVRKRIYATK